ncbi:MAG: DNA/RNA nuclease SfsA, partial [Deltaproteobacteria bacterium]
MPAPAGESRHQRAQLLNQVGDQADRRPVGELASTHPSDRRGGRSWLGWALSPLVRSASALCCLRALLVLSSLTRNLTVARFIDRPNRFIVRCEAPGLGRLRAHMPNPGRMWELLLPAVRLWLAPAPRAADSTRRTAYTVVAVERDGEPVLVHTHASNDVARQLVEQRRIPGLEDAEILAAEVKVGHSRFDFLLRRARQQVLMEVKSVTLFGNQMAMFPDAPTLRGRRHLEELATQSSRGARPVVLFLVHSRRVDRFLPDYHTDLEFAHTLLRLRSQLDVVVAAIGWRPALGLPRRVDRLPIDWSMLAREAQDGGAYLLLLRLTRAHSVRIGKLGTRRFDAGYYLYVGSAMRNLTARINRHLRKTKTHHW